MPEVFTDEDYSEHYIKKGDPGAPTYFIIRRLNTSVGLFSNYCVFAGQIRYALSNGYIPVIDMQNYPNQMLAPELLGKENAWEYFFKQPFNIPLEQAYKGENIILSNDTPSSGSLPTSMDYFKNKNNILTEWRVLVKWGLLKVQPHLQNEINELYEKFFSKNDRVLGVLLRGTDYIAMRPNQHPIPPPYRVCITKSYTKFA